MIVKVDPLVTGLIILALGWGLNKLTSEPICEKTIIKDGAEYSIPIYCSEVPNDT
ncbi:hypothetical protein [Aliivibrio salmonicida]|uniref:hypothetical protein n=1 Tax=Aliivibrio salmonicida TaxID=40269 RepID=UPI003D1423D9